ncbi:hypothetical protein EST38_g7496 [Candolleomyces aberdarensis]|uniref:G protein-coupled receptor n=1 Tax=Candolleomyces aberdarensis TaxID=2316362 RepID=A0A4V1Q3F1_9AGAR|nr:hypothetical protein EST38_g7496 [Candolleomyces aberdarensis]
MVEVGIHVFMSLYGLSVFLETPKHLRQGRRKYIMLSFLITILSALTGALDIAWMFQVLFRTTSGSEFFDVATEYNGNWDRSTDVISSGFTADGWRLYQHLLGFLIQATVSNPKINIDALSSASQLLTVATNIIVTTLITVHLIRTRRTLSKLLCPSIRADDPREVVLEYRNAGENRMYTKVISILIESAFPLSLFGVAAAIFQQIPVPRNQARAEAYLVWYHFIDGLFYSFCALSPHMIIFRVTIGRSWLKSPTMQQNGGNGALGPAANVDMEISKPIGFAHTVSGRQTTEIMIGTTYSGLEESSQRSFTAEELTDERRSDDFKLEEKSVL